MADRGGRATAGARRRAWMAAAVAGAVLVGACGGASDASDGLEARATDTRAERTTRTTERTTTSRRPTATTTRPTTSTSTTTPTAGVVPEGRRATVTRVVDGDTIEVDGGEDIRLIGINTPETKDPRKPVECFGREASAATEGLLPAGTAVVLEADVEPHDRYGRTLAYVHRVEDGVFVNLELVASGFAEVATYPPNVRHTDAFVAAQRDARAHDRGLWSACGGVGAPAAGSDASGVPAPAPVPPPSAPTAPAPPPPTPGGDCHPSYPTLCLPGAPDLDCGDIPAKDFPVLPPDPHRLDGNHDGVGCE